ncbi:MAG: hypothetical protein ACI9BW_000872 [Gammaproteobacteria bacterium]|jgi:hypothetical protein
MTTRRGFLVSSAAVMAGPSLVHAELAGSRTLVVIDSGSPEAELFSQYFVAPTSVLNFDPLNALAEMDGEFANHNIDTVYGLTRGSNRFLIEQLARPSGYRILYAGEHEFGNGQIAHKLTAPPSIMDNFAEHVVSAHGTWPVEIAPEPSTEIVRVVGAHVSEGCIGQLCSWTLQRV